MVTLTLGMFFAIDGVAAADILRQATNDRLEGVNALVIVADDRIDAARCDALARYPRVVASAALRGGGAVRSVTAPRSPAPVIAATSGIVAILNEESLPQNGGLLVSNALADELGLDEGMHITQVTGELSPVARVFEAAEKHPEFERVAVDVVAAHGRFDRCIVDLWPPLESDRLTLTTVIQGSQADNIRMTQLNDRRGPPVDHRTLLLSRPTRRLGFGAALLVGVAAIGSVRVRRREISVSLQLGVSRWSITFMTVIEVWAWATVAVAIAYPVSVVVATRSLRTAEATYLLVDHLRVASVSLLGAVVLGVAASLTIRASQVLRNLRDVA